MTNRYIFLLFYSVSLWAQKPIETDRPDQTETAKIVPPGKFQAESGFLHQHNDVHDNEYQLPETLLKFGLNSKLELRLITTLAYQSVNDSVTCGLEPVTIGFKLALWKQQGLLPQTSVIGHLQLSKIATKELQEDYLAPEVRLLFLNKVSKDIEIGYNLGIKWNGQSGQPEYAYTLAPDFKLGNRLSTYIETFAYLPQNHHADHWADAGFKYLITNNIQVDLSGGYELSSHDKKHSYFESVGLSFRL
jgi:Putative MetA-pathway of phenol degradation